MIRINLNGGEKIIDDETSISDILIEVGYLRSIVILNGMPLNIKERSEKKLVDGDSLKVFRVVAGG